MIRRAEFRDSEVLADLAGQLGYPSTSEDIVARLTMLRESGDDEVFVADNGEVEGWIQIGITRTLESGEIAEIRGLVVTESRRGSGIGGELVRVAEEWTRARKLTRLRVRTNVTRTQTHAFYEKQGFVCRKESKVYEKTLSSAPTAEASSPRANSRRATE